MKDLKTVINAYFNFYNKARFHQSLDYNVPDEMYKCFQYNELERKRAASPVVRFSAHENKRVLRKQKPQHATACKHP
ncbi:hypothetical protein, partial [Treponema berlinense]|uniref:hypothetical protein n=1 Tax=Treponema berlinense TaxID=225004 RepID=UPI002355D661